MACEMAEKFGPQVSRRLDEGVAGDPARHAPQQVVRRDESDDEDEGRPGTARRRRVRQRVDQPLDSILGADRTGHGAEDSQQDDGVSDGISADGADEKGDRPIPEAA